MYNTLRLLLILILGSQLSAIAQTSTYGSSGAYTYTVPAGVTGINVTVKGAQGGLNSDEVDYPDRQGYGGCVTAYIMVTPGQVLDVNVGGCGGNGTATAGGAGGFNGGGNGTYGTSIYSGGGGGGASDIRLSTGALTDRLVVAGGGGGAGINCGNERGGDGGSATPLSGGENGQAGCSSETGGQGGPYGGTTGVGGTGGICSSCGGSAGTSGDNSNGGNGGFASAGGGGGGGWSAGGGGQWTGGGGGSDYYSATGVTMLTESKGCNSSCGYVSITASCSTGNITGSNQVCQGTTNAPFTGVLGSGTWSSSNNTIATVGTTGAVFGVNSGSVTITYSLSTLCYATFPMTVNAAPSAISGTPVLCVNQTTTVTEFTPGGTWSTSNPGVATVGSNSGLVTGIGAGICNISFTVTATGCNTDVVFTVNQIPDVVVGPDSVCVGSSITVSDDSAGGTWTNVGSHASIVASGSTATVNGITAGVDIISYTYSSTGCAAAFPVTVNANPSGIGGPAFICMGQSGTETDVTSGGSWSIIAGTGTATIGSSNGLVNPISTGTVTVIYTLQTTCSVSRTISIDPSPAAITPPNPQVCQGSTIILTDPTSGGSWSSVSGGVASIVGSGTTGTVSGLAVAGGTSIISYLVGSCAATVVVTVNPKPTAITGPTQVCVGDCGEVYASGPGVGTWVSSSPAVATIDGTTGTLCAITPGTTTLTFTFTSTGCQRSIIVTVNPNPTVTAASLQVCLGYTTTLNPTPPGGTWTTTSGIISLTAGGTVTGSSLGTADVTYTATTTCTVIATVTVNPLPDPIVASANPICVGQTATLTSGGGAGTWVSNLMPVETITSSGPTTGLALGGAGGVATNTFTITATGCFATYDMTVIALPTFTVAPPAAMCVGTTATVTGNGGSGNWTSSNLGAATVVTGPGPGPGGTITAVAAGITNMCYTFVSAPGCQLCQTMDVVPALTPISGPHQVCTGASITLTSGPAGGVWTSTPPVTVVGAGATATVTGATTAGSPATVTYTLGTCSATYLVTVNQSPNPITVTAPNSFNICQGLTTTMCTTVYGPGGYTWSSSNPLVASITSAGLCATATGVSSGIALIDYTSFFTGCFSQATVNVTNGVGAITGPNFVCMGSTAIETETPTIGNWSSSSGIATVTGGAPGPMVVNTTVTPVSPGVFTLTFLASTGCTATKSMTVDALPSNTVIPLGSTNLCPGGSVELTASTGTGYTYQWGNPGAIGGATGATFVAATAGTYVVTVTGPGPCSITSAGTGITMNPVTATVSPGVATTACASAGLTLTASAATTYQWMLGGVAVSGAIAGTYTPTVSGSYSVEETNTFGCVGTSPAVSITLAPSPAGVVAISGSLNLCAGASVTLTSDAGAGYTYQWYNGSLASPIAGATGISFTTSTAGNYFVVDVNSTGCSTTSATSVVKVNPLPVAAIDTATSPIFCAGGSVSLSTLSSALDLYQWFKNGVAITGATNAVYVASATGNYTVQVDSVVIGCTSTSTVQAVTAVGVPVLNLISSSSFCWGSSADMAAVVTSGAGTIDYQWQIAGVNIAGATNSTYPATVSGSYSVEIFVHGGLCNETSSAISVTEWPLPNPLVTDTLPNLYTQTNFVTYQWYLNTILIPGATSSNTPIIGNGTYKVKVTDTHGCQSVSTGFPVSGWVPNAISTVNAGSEIKIYPNPAQDALHIDAPMAVRAVICSMDGRTLIDQQSATDINISTLANGIYTIRLYDANGNQLKVDKFVKESN